jgi:hypothetical protein
MAIAGVPSDFLLIPKTNAQLSHVRAVDAGGGGEVHEVLILAYRNTDLPLGFRPRDWQSKSLADL